MTKLRKQRRRKVFRHNMNRKRLRNKLTSTGPIPCAEIKNAWEDRKSLQRNLKEMGLSHNANETIKIPNSKKAFKEKLLQSQPDYKEEKKEEIDDVQSTDKSFVVKALEADAKAPREKRFEYSNNQAEWVTYLLLKYKCDYKAMARDHKNYNQETWKQLRAKVRRFRTIPKQYNKFLKDNNLKDTMFEEEALSDNEL